VTVAGQQSTGAALEIGSPVEEATLGLLKDLVR